MNRQSPSERAIRMLSLRRRLAELTVVTDYLLSTPTPAAPGLRPRPLVARPKGDGPRSVAWANIHRYLAEVRGEPAKPVVVVKTPAQAKKLFGPTQAETDAAAKFFEPIGTIPYPIGAQVPDAAQCRTDDAPEVT